MTIAPESAVRAPEPVLRGLVTEIFESCHMSAQHASLLADTLVVADLGGIHSHGVLRVAEYVKKLTVEGVDPVGKPHIVNEFGSCLVVSGDNSMGQIAAQFAMEEVISRARESGIAAAGIRDSNHCGAVGYFAEQAVRYDMIGIATTNALPTMAPWGGAEKILGINPLAVGIPAGDEKPILYDAAFSGSSHGKIRIHHQKGIEIPATWALDAQGRPTTDPAAAIDGLLLPIGGFKGAGLAMVMGILSSMLSGASYGTELGNMNDGPRAGEDGHFVAAIKVEAFEVIERFKKRGDAAIRQIHASRLAPGFDRTYAPGEMELLRRDQYSSEGIPLDSVTLAELGRTALALGIDISGFDWIPSKD